MRWFAWIYAEKRFDLIFTTNDTIRTHSQIFKYSNELNIINCRPGLSNHDDDNFVCCAFQLTYVLDGFCHSIASPINLTQLFEQTSLHIFNYIFPFQCWHNSNNTYYAKGCTSRRVAIFLFLSFDFINFLTKAIKKKSRFANFFFLLLLSSYMNEQEICITRERKSVSLQIMYWTEEIKRASHIFTLYLSIKNVLMCLMGFVYERRWKNVKNKKISWEKTSEERSNR